MVIQPNDSFSTQLEVCYEIKLYLATLLHRLEPGEVLEFISTDPNAQAELETWAVLRGHELVDIQPLDAQRTRFLIRKGD